MQHYVGTKRILAREMDRADYNNYRGWELPSDEDGTDLGYLVEYLDGGKANHPDHEGYVSWSPKDVFEKAYQASGSLSFGHAIELLKQGHKVARSGWNGKDMYLIMVPGTEKAQLRDGTPYKDATGLDELEILPHIDMWTVNSFGRRAMLPGWLASQTDMLSEDWYIVD